MSGIPLVKLYDTFSESFCKGFGTREGIKSHSKVAGCTIV